MTYQKCVVFSCANSTSKRGSLSFYRFPIDPGLCEKWVEFCKSDKVNDKLVLEGVEKVRKSWFSVCSDHFERTCFVNPKLPSQGIYKGSIPTVIAGHPVLISNFKKINQIPEYSEPHFKQRVDSEPTTSANVLSAQLNKTKVPTGRPIPEPPKNDEQPKAQEVNRNFHPGILACECGQTNEYRPKFFAERTRAVGLVQQYKTTKKKLSETRRPCSVRMRALARIDISIKNIKDKIRALANEYHTTIELESSDDNEEEL
ncbi:52 kDa repressor of the inhibitor of the protein kinase-like [Armigeres subalbatus]|uniref:52 kDa repressor of the inhibitor of the protein kinase-like n=1 Tax=Armigeres subalbatus TaxID=124917 RepID=UPI002ED6C0FF